MKTHLSKLQTVQEREDAVVSLLAGLPRSSIANVQVRIGPMLRLDILGLLPDEVALHIFSFLPWESLVTCMLVSKRWGALAGDGSLWRRLCHHKKWEWRSYASCRRDDHTPPIYGDSDDEGMGDEDEDDLVEHMLLDDSGFSSMSMEARRASTSTSHIVRSLPVPASPVRRPIPLPWHIPIRRHPPPPLKPDYKLLFATHMRLNHRFNSGSYSLSTLQTRGAPNGHSNTIYCLQLYTYPDTGVQVLFTGSKDRSIREWDIATGGLRRVIEGVHEGSVLSICVYNGLLVSGGSDRKVVVWSLARNEAVRVLRDHTDSVLCVRFNERRLVSCSKDRTIRTYLLPDFRRQFRLEDHRAAVNAISLSGDFIVSGSGDRSMKIWSAETGELIRTFDNHHGRGLAAIDFEAPYVLSGSSDKHLRLVDIATGRGWSTSPDIDEAVGVQATAGAPCPACGGAPKPPAPRVPQKTHEDLVRSVVLNADFVVSGSYDHTVKVWDRHTGALVADLAGGHTGRIFCVGFDHSKIVSCGEDQRICVWDFSHGIETSFVKLQ
ncbi:F-box/WD repeat-containing protein [Phanerochaete sordida]|uniref:F-box/WD repeat-containing protein n=1 Tax=Phanerochaete sordida TaxID=48140 RepID=A0A9P3GK48_9APHY|nr:F-box/WD repeat-containing protein [Phanerochaete sordida]